MNIAPKVVVLATLSAIAASVSITVFLKSLDIEVSGVMGAIIGAITAGATTAKLNKTLLKEKENEDSDDDSG